MNTLKAFIFSSIGQKVTMAATGLFLCVFLIEHLYGNVLLYFNDGGAAFNEYSHSATHSIIIRTIEIFLFAAIIIHVIQAISLTRQNAVARPVKYAGGKATQGTSWFSRNMGVTGSVIFFFIVVHLYNFFVPYRITEMPANTNLAQLVKTAFHSPLYAGLYFVAVTFLFFHLNHGFRSAFHTVGLNDKKYNTLLKNTGTAFAILMWIGFASFPVLFYFGIAGTSF
jgi:succinate dehydrogenase / fumarate reductase cytochrome b subunit